MHDELTTLTAFTSRHPYKGINPAILWDTIENREFRAPLRGTSVSHDPHGNRLPMPDGTGRTIKVPDAMYPEDLVHAALLHYLTDRSEGLDLAMESAAWVQANLNPWERDSLHDAPYRDPIASQWMSEEESGIIGYVTYDGWVVSHEDEGWVVTGHYGEYRQQLVEETRVALRL